MRVRQVTFIAPLVCLGLALNLLDGCARREDGHNRIRIVGSTSVFPFAEMLAEAYEKTTSEALVDVQAGGSTVGIVSARDGLADIGTSSRNLHADEKEGMNIIEIARDGIAVIVHPSNKVTSLTTEQIRAIYAGHITHWRQVGGDDAEIGFVTREEGSGTRGAFTEMMMQKTRIAPSALVQDSNGSVREVVAISPHVIGYISVELVNEKVKAVAVDGIAPTPENLARGTYPIVRSLLFVTKGQAQGQVKHFIDFVLGPEGQKVLTDEGLLGALNP